MTDSNIKPEAINDKIESENLLNESFIDSDSPKVTIEDFRTHFLADINKEINKARKKFPSSNHLGLAYIEESGEFIKEILDFHNRKNDLTKGLRKEKIYREAVQTVAMIFRLLEEGSGELNFDGLFK